MKLPGIGPYTAAAISAIAFGKKATPVDGNIERVVTRLFAIKEPIPKSKKKLKKLAYSITPEVRAGDFAQSLMDIGATICTPIKPMCNICPLTGECKAEDENIAGVLPIRAPKKIKPIRIGIIYWLSNDNGEVLFRRRPEKGLLGGMAVLPSSDWHENNRPPEFVFIGAPVAVDWQMLPGKVKHTFTHFHLELHIAIGQCPKTESIEGIWCRTANFGELALPTVMKKVVAHTLKYIN
jgi:A/G-specific adenine glycosylase